MTERNGVDRSDIRSTIRLKRNHFQKEDLAVEARVAKMDVKPTAGDELAGLIKNVMDPPKNVLDRRRFWRISGRAILELTAVDRSETH